MEPVIEVKNVTKKFRVYYDKGNSFKEKVLFKKRNQYEERVVLDDISFSLNKGEALGLIGKNGCGKSTILKLMNRIMYADTGEIKTTGRISSLIELGAGFHPDMTGRENIYTNASIFGLTRKEISKRMDSIIKFSEMEKFLDNPVRTYSSGMYMRLAFSVAINVDADILLIDEILGVGDISFQAKCFEKLRDIKASGTTIAIVSHSLAQLEQICDKTIWLEDGKIKEEGIPKYVHEHYLYSMEEERLDKIEQEFQDNIRKKQKEKVEKVIDLTEDNTKIQEIEDKLLLREKGQKIDFGTTKSIRRGNQLISFTNVSLMNASKSPQFIFKTGDTIILKMDYKTNQPGLDMNVGYAIYRDDGLYCYGTNCIFELGSPIKAAKSGTIIVKMEDFLLLPNRYMFDIAIQSPNGIEYDNICFAAEFQIMLDKRDTGVSRIGSTWIIDEM